jgi:hypothetical protein
MARFLPSSNGVRLRRGFISLLFVVPAVVLVAQTVCEWAGLGEPYPALMMPGFEGTRSSAGIIRTSAVEVEVLFADSPEVERTTMAALLAPMPGSIVPVAAANVFRSTPVRPASAAPQVAFRHRVRDAVMPSRQERVRRRAGGNAPSPELIDWTRTRLATIYPGRVAREMVVHWIEDHHRLRGRTVERVGRVEVSTYRVPLQ